MFAIIKFLTKWLPVEQVKKIPGAAPIYRALYSWTKPQGQGLLSWHGLKVHLDFSDEGVARPLLLTGEYEPFEMQIFAAQVIKSNSWVIDVGANIGLYTMTAARALCGAGDTGVLSFEPSPKMYNFLLNNLRENKLNNVVALPMALSDHGGETTLYLDDKNLGNPSLAAKNIRASGSAIKASCSTLDEVLKSRSLLGKARLLKMDVQGAEAKVLQGARNWLLQPELVLLFEFWPDGIRNCGDDPAQMLIELKSMGFRFSILDSQRQKVTPASCEAIMAHCRMRKTGEAFTNILAER